MNKIVIPAILAATVLVAGFALSSNLFTSKVEARHSNTGPCAVEEHWDKIIFKIVRDPAGALDGTDIPLKTELDIKVEDNPNDIADIKQKVRDFLLDHRGIDSSQLVIDIIDVEYAIMCIPPS